MNRREFARMSTAAMVATVLRDIVEARGQQNAHGRAMAEAATRHAALLAGPKLTIALMPYPGMFLQDLVGPLTLFEALMNRDVLLVWKDTQPMPVGSGMMLTPTTTFSQCPANLDVLFVPGGVPGTFAMMEDADVLAFLAARGATARYVTSVCTGSLILGAAGLLTGYKATSYWSTRDVLAEFGAIPTADRIVVDRNRITGGGVTAGLDFGLRVIAELRSRTYAEAVQLYVEYDPQPPFKAGAPTTAQPAARAFVDEMVGPFAQTARETARRSQRRRQQGPA